MGNKHYLIKFEKSGWYIKSESRDGLSCKLTDYLKYSKKYTLEQAELAQSKYLDSTKIVSVFDLYPSAKTVQDAIIIENHETTLNF